MYATGEGSRPASQHVCPWLKASCCLSDHLLGIFSSASHNTGGVPGDTRPPALPCHPCTLQPCCLLSSISLLGKHLEIFLCRGQESFWSPGPCLALATNISPRKPGSFDSSPNSMKVCSFGEVLWLQRWWEGWDPVCSVVLSALIGCWGNQWLLAHISSLPWFLLLQGLLKKDPGCVASKN